MKLKAFSAIALASAAILISQGAHAQSNMDGNGQAEPSAEQRAAADANAARFKEGAANLFSLGKKLVNQGVDAAKSGAATLNEKAQAAQSPSSDAGAPSANAASFPSLATQAAGLANSQGGKIAKQMLSGLIPGGSNFLEAGSKLLDAKAKSDAKSSSTNGANATALQAQAPSGDNATPSIQGANLVKAGLSFGGGLLDKLKAKRSEASSTPPATENSPSP